MSQAVPRAVRVSPPFAVTVAPSVAEVVATLETVGEPIVGAMAAMLKVRFADALVPPVLLAVTATMVPLPATVGVPEICPEVAFSERPAGNVPLLIS